MGALPSHGATEETKYPESDEVEGYTVTCTNVDDDSDTKTEEAEMEDWNGDRRQQFGVVLYGLTVNTTYTIRITARKGEETATAERTVTTPDKLMENPGGSYGENEGEENEGEENEGEETRVRRTRVRRTRVRRRRRVARLPPRLLRRHETASQRRRRRRRLVGRLVWRRRWRRRRRRRWLVCTPDLRSSWLVCTPDPLRYDAPGYH